MRKESCVESDDDAWASREVGIVLRLTWAMPAWGRARLKWRRRRSPRRPGAGYRQ